MGLTLARGCSSAEPATGQPESGRIGCRPVHGRAAALSCPLTASRDPPMPDGYLIAPDPAAPRLTRAVAGVDHDGRAVETRVVEERPLTIYLNAQEIVTAMTIG